MVLLGDCRDEYNYALFKYVAKHSTQNVRLIIFPKLNTNSDIKKILKLFRYKVIFFKENYPHKNRKILTIIKKEEIQKAISLAFSYRIRKSFLKLFNPGIFNFHPGLIQYNRGLHSAFWSIYNNNDFGCTLHLMNEKFDEGKIYDQVVYKKNLSLNADDVHKFSNMARLKLLKKNLNNILKNKITPNIKINKRGTYYRKKSIQKKINLNESQNIKVSNLFKIIRGTLHDKHGVFFKIGKKFKVLSKIIEIY